MTAQDPTISGEQYPGAGDGGVGASGDFTGPHTKLVVGANLDGTLLGEPVTWWLIILGGGMLIYFWMHTKGGMGGDFATTRWSLGDWFWDGMKVATFFFAFKAAMRIIPVPGLSAFAGGI